MRKAYASGKLLPQIFLLVSYPILWCVLITIFARVFALNIYDDVGEALGKILEEIFFSGVIYLAFTIFAVKKFGKFQYLIAATTLIYGYVIFSNSDYEGWKFFCELVLLISVANVIIFLIHKSFSKRVGVVVAAVAYVIIVSLSGIGLRHVSATNNLSRQIKAADAPIYWSNGDSDFPYKSFQYLVDESAPYYSFNFEPTVAVTEFDSFEFNPPSDCGVNPAFGIQTARPCTLVGTAANGSELWRYNDTAYQRVEYYLRIDNTIINIAPGSSRMSDTQALAFAGSFKSISQNQLFQKDPASATSMKNELKNHY